VGVLQIPRGRIRYSAAAYLVFKVIERLSGNWRALDGGENLMVLVLEGCAFKDGLRKGRSPIDQLTTAAA
jgi:hypothetical protein